MKRSEVIEILTYVMSDFHVEISDQKTSVWFDQIGHLDFQFAKKAAVAFMREKRFGIPQIADFLQVVDELTKPAKDRMTGGEAWEMVLNLARRHGRDGIGAVSKALAEYPRIYSALRQVGYTHVCNCPLEELHFTQKRFIEFYDSLHERDQTDKVLQGRIGTTVTQAPQVKKLTDATVDKVRSIDFTSGTKKV